MPRLPDPSHNAKDDMPLYLYVAGACEAYAISGKHGLILLTLVTDTGPGLTPKELDMLFQRFSQVSRQSSMMLRVPFDISTAKTHTIFGGSGLGLFVCRSPSVQLSRRQLLTLLLCRDYRAQ